jgi:thioredoxin reductase/ferredoxin
LDTATIALLGAAILAILAALARWQRRIDAQATLRIVAELREAEGTGSARALAQYPQIDPVACIGCGSCIAACPETGVIGLIDGIARVIHGSRCIGHARCEEQCPVGAIRVGLGDISGRSDIPILTENLETSVPGIFIAGELGGIALIRHAIDQGRVAAEAAAARAREIPTPAGLLDLLIVGSGPAGISASLRAKELGLSSRTIDRDELGGTVRKYPRRKLTLLQTVELPLHGKIRGREYAKEELIELWERVIAEHELPISTGISLSGGRAEGDTIIAETSAGEVRARSVILALGRRGTPRRLGVPGEELEKVLYRLVDAATWRDQRILVVGGGDSAIEAATALADQPGNQVTLSYRKESFHRLKARNAERLAEYRSAKRLRVLLRSQVVRIEDGLVVVELHTAGTERLYRLANDAVFIFAGGDPPFPLLHRFGIAFGGGEGAPAPTGATAGATA